MCTLVLLHRPGTDWPLLIAANRDERLARPWLPPARHWPDMAVTGGLDTVAGGTWMAINDQGVVAAVLNRTGTLGPVAGKRSRGDLPILALHYRSAEEAVQAIAQLDAGAWRGFHLVVADRSHAFCLIGKSLPGKPEVIPLKAGINMFTAHDPHHTPSPRAARFLPIFQTIAAPSLPDWGAWPAIMANQDAPHESRICLPEKNGYGTVCSSLLGVSSNNDLIWQFAPGNPHTTKYRPVKIR
ncbi:NRDE family protein [Granulibacter bethesdensis]|uniref:Uncharacterized protein n=1 Tax=Granulibacter bethesdensis (strain ATCC BAA-1260 / CGDNIH1) TaxID=391165 RepID=Q0BRJ5_GRABC|nr:NRDE family protein [Granulibacter bethesdensis]ABI62557.1 Hypothetical protein GbCGDNIH1_1659 [Granulibacter bethesdensis CGDNIH1]AHJ68501.1 Hypothetical protein GbCGDNIH2_1659 [Granulibacter bethesdensis]APH52407.1 Hypothetical protein GbCGDNIH5_1659 [Granulibacter bethesdensis]APH65097.1 Hypothetical protein GbCGDNIH1I4_1659 [Granulibacter bethesdensis]